MIKYTPTKLFAICLNIIEKRNSHKKRYNENKINEEASKLEKNLVEDAKKEILTNMNNYKDEITDPYKIFYFKKQKTLGFYKEYLEIEEIKKYIPLMQKIFINELNVEELNTITEKFTNGKIKTFNQYYYLAMKNYNEKLANKIAIKKAIEIYSTIELK